MDDELGEGGGATIGVATMPEEEGGEMGELGDGEVSGEGGLSTFFAYNANA